MMRRNVRWFALCSAVLWVACDEPPEQKGPVPLGPLMDGGMMTSNDGAAPDASLPDGGSETPDGSSPMTLDSGMAAIDSGPPPRTGPAFAVVSSDWMATSISILDPQGTVLADNYLNSGSQPAGLVTALSGDVELPKRSGETGVAVILDRFRTDVITRVRLADGAILGQVKTHTPPSQVTENAYSSNPHDYIYIDEQTAWITRAEPNLDPSVPEIDRGNDLFRIVPATMQRAGERIDLSALDAVAMRTDPGTGAQTEVKLYAKPSRMVRLGGTVVVGVSRLAFDFSAVGPGAVALVNLDTKTVSAFQLEGLQNCANVNAVPNDVDTVLVTCAGDFNADARASAGHALLGVSNGVATIEHVWRAQNDAAATALISSSVSLGGTLIAAGINDYSGAGPDVFAVLDLATGLKTELVSASPGSGRFGTPAYDAASGLLLLPDASVDANKVPTAGVRRFQRNADGSFRQLDLVRVANATGMPVRHVYPL